MRFIIFLLFTAFLVRDAYSQKEDFIWPLGNNGGSTIDRMLADSINKIFWPFNFNFNHDPMQIEYVLNRKSNPTGALAAICEGDGELFCFGHGRSIFAYDEGFAINGDTIGYDSIWEYFNIAPYNLGYRIFQGMIMLPYPDKEDSIFYLSPIIDYDDQVQTGVYWGIITGYRNHDRPKVVLKDQVIDHTLLQTGMMKAVRHGNGRDWWIILISGDNTTYFTYLLNPTGLHLVHNQKVGKYQRGYNSGNATFSYDGRKYAAIDGRYHNEEAIVSVFDFDRCTGKLSKPNHRKIKIMRYGLGQSVTFSPNGRYLYYNNDTVLYQMDLKRNGYPETFIAEYDGFESFPDMWTSYTPFGFWAEGPDGKLYNVSGAGVAFHMHIMDYPDEPGVSCSFRQHALRIPNNPWTIPNFPHYRLGPLDGSPCDTLGLDNYPVAKFRYEPDSLDYLRMRFTDLSYFRPESWTWNFGDGSPQESTKSPYHTFPHQGVYHVCLTVSNENSSNTTCRDIALGTSSSADISASKADITTFPIPVEDYLLVTLGEYVPAHGEISLYDISGHPVLTQRLYYGQNSIDMQSLPSGIYLWRFTDGSEQVREGKVVKR